MLVAIHQPHYLPWLGYLDKVDRADAFVALDTVQFSKHGFQNRNKVRTANGSVFLTVPIRREGGLQRRLFEVQIDNTHAWAKKHWKTISQAYGKAPYFGHYSSFFEELYSRQWEKLVDLCLVILEFLKDAFEISTPVYKASSFTTREEPTARLVDLCLALGADSYLAGAGSRGYMDLRLFEDAGLEVIFQNFVHPVYPQCYEPFEPAMAAIDLLFNCGGRGFELVRRSREGLS